MHSGRRRRGTGCGLAPSGRVVLYSPLMGRKYGDAGRCGRPGSTRFLAATLAGSLAMALVSAFAPPEAQLAVLGSGISMLTGLLLARMERDEAREKRRDELLERLGVPLALAPEHDLFEQYTALSDALAAVARSTDPVPRDVASLKLASIVEEVLELARGQVIFTGTETWRAVYERVLDRPGVNHYRSAAWVRTSAYWQDAPGRQSMQLNRELAGRGVRIERVLILPPGLWPEGRAAPAAAIRGWIDEQRSSGIAISLIREGDLAAEPDLVCDFGIYGDVAVGAHELDGGSRTVRFPALVRPSKSEACPRPLGAAPPLRNTLSDGCVVRHEARLNDALSGILIFRWPCKSVAVGSVRMNGV